MQILFNVFVRVFANIAINIIINVIEQKPPVNDEYDDYQL